MATKTELEARIVELETQIIDGVTDESVQSLVEDLKGRTVAAEEKAVSLEGEIVSLEGEIVSLDGEIVSLEEKLEKALKKPSVKKDEDPKPECFGEYPEYPEDVTKKCRVCKDHAVCKVSGSLPVEVE